MNRISLHVYLLLLLNVVSTSWLNGQLIRSIQPDERVVLFSDRTLYIAGEPILFSAYIKSEIETKETEPERVLYCELIEPDGKKIAGKKYLILNSASSGFLDIPNDITTGVYYLRAYTKFMRNAGPTNYHYTRIKIINANKSDIQAITENTNSNSKDSLSYGINPVETGTVLHISTDKSEYATRDTVHLYIRDNETAGSSWKALNIAVIPEFSVSEAIIKIPENGQSEKKLFFYPESSGLSITGKVTDNATGNPLPGTLINLSIIGKGRDFMAVQTDNEGRFFFSLPDYIGFRDVFICAENIRTGTPKILVDNDFCTIPVHIPSDNFSLTTQERKAAFNMAVNLQLGSFFNIDSIPGSENDRDVDQSFYGKPNETFYIDNYIQLPTLEEYFNGLPSSVKVRTRQGEKYFKVIGTQSALADFDPLVLIDLVAIDDPKKVLAISPLNISRIEIVNMVYVKGDQTYGGIINIISKHGDFAGIDLPSSGIFINYGFLADNINSKRSIPKTPHTPDTRNTLYWKPQIMLNKGSIMKDSFTVSDTPGRYLIIINGINSKGEVSRQTSAFEVVK